MFKFNKFLIWKHFLNNAHILNLIILKLNFFKFRFKKIHTYFDNDNKLIKNNECSFKIKDKLEEKFFHPAPFFKFQEFFKYKKINNFSFSFFLTFNFLYSFTSFDHFHKHNHFYNFFYFKNYKKKYISINLNKFLNRWQNAQNLIFNIYYYEYYPLVFGSFDYKNEIFALNWHNFFFDSKFWKYSSNFFIFKINKYGEKVFYFYNKIFSLDITFFLISNLIYHYKNLYYFKKLNFFTIGLVNSNFSPLQFSYAIPTISINTLNEFFFLKLLVFLNKNVLFSKYFFFKNNWFSYFIYLKSQINLKFHVK